MTLMTNIVGRKKPEVPMPLAKYTMCLSTLYQSIVTRLLKITPLSNALHKMGIAVNNYYILGQN